jgi:hypothetical protein
MDVYKGGLHEMRYIECGGSPAPQMNGKDGVATIVTTDRMPAWRFYWIAFTRR